ncbi:hypothetical protein Ahy_A09g041562 isoform C [Arachis hypogaea]|uniref:PA domain-containing protein n=1 Tax=Arachis hypogaea TaxID=3818 RepID=A0A445BD45_ARAHY|nr:hypothetical protein Ahy_A09g041562 isoform C [Arachis hypogaea]
MIFNQKLCPFVLFKSFALMGTSNLLLFLFSLLGLCALSAAKVVLIGNNITLSFDDIEANFEPLDACTDLSNKAPQLPNASLPFVLMIRGGCSFEEKVRRAQAAGYKAAIVYDNEDSGVLVAKGKGLKLLVFVNFMV